MKTRLLLLLVPLLLSAGRCHLPPPPTADGDLDDDGIVTEVDWQALLDCLGVAPAGDPVCAPADLDGDGDVDLADAYLLRSQLGLAVCNGSPALCDRPYDQVAYATTHNAHAIFPGYFPPANQNFPMSVQLADGVRGLMIDTWYYDADGDGTTDGAFLCHTLPFCGYPDPVTLVDGLVEIKGWLDAHPAEVVTLIFESYVSAADTAAAFAEAGLLDPASPGTDDLYAHPGGPWPTLGEMIASGERLVVLTDHAPTAAEAAQYPWHHYLWASLAFETPFDLTPQEFPVPGFSCTHNRGDPGNDLFILNHFLTQVIGHPSLAEMVNHSPFFLDRARECEQFQGHIPNFVTVDYYEIGDVFDVVDALNGL